MGSFKIKRLQLPKKFIEILEKQNLHSCKVSSFLKFSTKSTSLNSIFCYIPAFFVAERNNNLTLWGVISSIRVNKIIFVIYCGMFLALAKRNYP